MTQESFGQKLGVRKTAISKIENGENNLTEQMIKLIYTEFNVNDNWLRTGQGAMFIEPDTFSLDAYAKQKGCSDSQIKLIKSLLDLDHDTVLQLIKAFKNAYDEISEEELSATIDTSSSESSTCEAAATDDCSVDEAISKELACYRLELEATKRGEISSASENTKGKIS